MSKLKTYLKLAWLFKTPLVHLTGNTWRVMNVSLGMRYFGDKPRMKHGT